MSEDKNRQQRNERGKMVAGIILTGIGLLFLLNNLDVLDIGDSWPLILIVVGLALVVGALRKDEGSESPPSRST